MQFLKALWAALSLIGVTGFRLGNYTVSATVGGAPHHLTIGEALLAAEKALTGSVGTFLVGSVTLTVAPYVAPAPVNPTAGP